MNQMSRSRNSDPVLKQQKVSPFPIPQNPRGTSHSQLSNDVLKKSRHLEILSDSTNYKKVI